MKKSTHRSYSEAYVQTIVQDPDNHLQNFQSHPSLSVSSIQKQKDTQKATHSLIEISVHDDDNRDNEDDKLAFQLQKRLNPTKQEDFVVLQSELLQWRRREELKILTCADVERKKELTKALLVKETYLLRKIEALKDVVHKKVKTNRVEQRINQMCQPKIWGDVAVETPKTRLARETKELYDDVRKKVEIMPARIDLLQRIKDFLHRMHFNPIVKDILVLVNRELEIITRDTELGNDMMEGLRIRLTNLFAKLLFKTNTVADGLNTTIKPKLLIDKERRP
ncbi:hypothetical protein ACHAXM_009546 [Skeletonema potamos]|jgi:hypothetical protein